MTVLGAQLLETLLLYAPLYARIQAFILALPAFSERLLNARVKVAVAVALVPVFAVPLPSTTLLPFLGVIAVEMVIGFVLAMPVRLFGTALGIAASAIASAASLSQIIGGQTEAAPHPVGNLMHMAGLAMLMTLGFPLMVVDLLDSSLILWPIGQPPQVAGVLPHIVSTIAMAFQVAMTLAAPFILGGMLYQLLSGVINKVMPSLPVVFIGSSGAILLALSGLVVLAPLLIRLWADMLLSMTVPQ